MRKRTTKGMDWLEHSMASFNGSGYADRTSAKSFLNSYLSYKWTKRDNYAINTVDKSYKGAMQIARKLMNAKLVGQKPIQKRLENFSKYHNPINNSITNYPTTKQLNCIYKLETQVGITNHFTPSNTRDAVSYIITLNSRLKELQQEQLNEQQEEIAREIKAKYL